MGIRLVQTHHVRRHAEQAIIGQLGHLPPEVIIAVERDKTCPTAVSLDLNNSRTSVACVETLQAAGYKVEPGGTTESGWGMRLRVLPA